MWGWTGKDRRARCPAGAYLFVSERGGPMTASNVRKLMANVPGPPVSRRHECPLCGRLTCLLNGSFWAVSGRA